MGAINIEMVLSGEPSSSEIKEAFKRQQGYDSSRNGHQDGYSGDFQTVDKVVIRMHRVFQSYDDATDYCLSEARKWETVIAVRYKEGDKINTLIAGWGAC
jgi:hypothetical protein